MARLVRRRPLHALRRTARRGATSVEYLLILAVVVLPLGVLVPLIVRMVATYTYRIGWAIRLPFG